jgi:ABC-2 type transport system permease protein
MRTLSAFLGRDLAYQAASKFAIVGQLASVLVMCAMMFFIGQTFGASSPALHVFRGRYFEFALVGIVFARFQSVALTSFAAAIRRDQASGTIEAILVTKTTVPAIVLGAASSSFIFTAIQAVLYLIAGALIFGVNLHQANIPAALAVLVLSMLAISPIGICAAASVIAFRQGDNALGMVTAATNVLGGVYFPISVLPLPLKWASAAFPITHGLAALRLALLRGAGFGAVSHDLAVLAAFAGVGIPLALALFIASIRYARRVGSLAYI